MMDFLLYDAKAAAALLVFYLFYRFLLKKETFHRFNRAVLVGTAVLAFLLPLCIITIRRPVEMAPLAIGAEIPVPQPAVRQAVPAAGATVSPYPSWGPAALTALFWAGVAFMLARALVSVLSIVRVIRQGRFVREEDGCKIIVTERDIDPFSWMRYIVLSRKDMDNPHESILIHEKAHIACGHSMEVLLADILSALQWFNPAIWMLRADLKELHEYEADDAVLRAGANIREYQYLLIRKAVSKSGYSVANSFNHSILKNRITMMSKSKSPLSRGLRVLWLLPLVCLAIGLQARTVYVPVHKDSEKISVGTKSGDDLPEVIVLDVRADGSFTVNGTLSRGSEVIIAAEADTPMGVIDDVRNMLRKVGALKVTYAGPSETASPVRHISPSATNGDVKVQTYDEALGSMDRNDVCVVRINSNDRIFFKDGACDDEADILRKGKAFLEEHGAKTCFLLSCDRATSYGAYQKIQSALTRIYSEVRNDKSREIYGKTLSELSGEELSDIYRLVPMGILETDMAG